METRLSKKLGKGPLPGERQGTSGAGAGRDSMRTTSGRLLMQRAPTGIPEEATAADTNTQPNPSRSVLQDIRPATTLAGKPRQRMKWTDEINRQLLHCYYTVTNLESNLTAYRTQLHTAFTAIYPELHEITAQRLADQIRVIVRNNRIPPPERENIKMNVANTLRRNEATGDENEQLNNTEVDIHTNHNHVLENNLTEIIETTRQNVPEQNKDPTNLAETTSYTDIENVFIETVIKYNGTDPTTRPAIPKLQHVHHAVQTIKIIDEIIKRRVDENSDLTFEELHLYIYCGALTVTRMHQKVQNRIDMQTKKHIDTKPPWQHRIEKKILNLRKEIGQLTQYLKGNLSAKTQQKSVPINKTKEELADLLDKKKQTLQAQAKRLRRYTKSNKRRKQNKMFNTNQKHFYRSLENDNINIKNPPKKEDLESFWKNIWSNSVEHNGNAEWISKETQHQQQTVPMPELTITTEDIQKSVGLTHNWKTPGGDKIHNFWLKSFKSVHTPLAIIFNNFLANPQSVPLFLTQGVTYLKPKDADTENPAKYRPITCLSTIYKLLTSIIAQKINTHLESNNIIAEEQKGCRKGARGCKEQLIIDTEIHTQAKQKRKSLYYAYIDYQKAYDSVPHSWLIQVLEIYKVHPKLILFLKTIMTNWKTALNIKTETKNITTDPINVARGIFQGDSLSALWFCMALNPLSKILNSTGYGYQIMGQHPHKVSHLLYMDDLKLMASTKRQLNSLLQITEQFSIDIHMAFGTNKCKVNSIIKGKHNQQEPYQLNNNDHIESMGPDDTYKYLGYQQKMGIEHTIIKQQLTEKYKKRLEKILKTELSGRNKVKAVNTYAVPVLTYSFGVVKWSDTELDALNRLTRTTCNKYKIHHIHSAVERFTIERKEGGRGFIDIKNMNYRQIANLRKYFQERSQVSPLHKAIMNSSTSGTPLQLNNNGFQPSEKIVTIQSKKNSWKQKTLHGKHPYQLEQPHIDQAASNAWLTKGNIFGETEGFMLAIQDQTVKTRNYSKYIIKDPEVRTDRCRLCNEQPETIDHVTGGCKILAQKEYLKRHDNVAKHIHQQIALKYKLFDHHTPDYKYTPKNVLENDKVKLYWNRDIITDRTMPHNKPDITLTTKSDKTTYLVEISVPNTTNLQKKTNEKIGKYLPLVDEIKQMWHQDKVQIVPVILSATGVIPKSLHHSIKILGLPENTYVPLQKSVIIDTCSITRQFLSANQPQ